MCYNVNMVQTTSQQLINQLNNLPDDKRILSLLDLARIFVLEQRLGEAYDAWRAAYHTAQSLHETTLLDYCQAAKDNIFSVGIDESLKEYKNEPGFIENNIDSLSMVEKEAENGVLREKRPAVVSVSSRISMNEDVKNYHKKLAMIAGSLPIRPVDYMYRAGILARSDEGLNGHNIETFKILLHNNIFNPNDARQALLISQIYDLSLEDVIRHLYILSLLNKIIVGVKKAKQKIFMANLTSLASMAVQARQKIKISQAPFILSGCLAEKVSVHCRHAGSKNEVLTCAYHNNHNHIFGWIHLTPARIIVAKALPYSQNNYEIADFIKKDSALVELFNL